MTKKPTNLDLHLAGLTRAQDDLEKAQLDLEVATQNVHTRELQLGQAVRRAYRADFTYARLRAATGFSYDKIRRLVNLPDPLATLTEKRMP